VAGIAAVAGVLGRRRWAWLAGAVWLLLTARFAIRRLAPGPRTASEVTDMVLTSAAIPPLACVHRLRGEVRARIAS
jgi:hypothetical protein